MKHDLAGLTAQYFFSTAPLPCPYLPGRTERRLVTELTGRNAVNVHDTLSRAGFRRSHGIAYVPVCRTCTACVAVRIVAGEFMPSRSQRRALARNDDLIAVERPPRAKRRFRNRPVSFCHRCHEAIAAAPECPARLRCRRAA